VFEVLYNVPDKEYHARTEVSSSAMKRALISPAHYQAYLNEEIEPTPAMELGTAIHGAILEQDFTKYIKGPDCRRGTKEWAAFEAENQGKIILKPDDYATIRGMYDAFFAHPNASKVVSKGKAEVSIIGTDEKSGLQVKGRIDYLVQSDKGNYILDYKSAQNAQMTDFRRSIFNYRYDLSLAHYKDITEKALSIKIDDCFLIVQEKTPPYALMIYRASDRMLEQGLNDRDKALYAIKQCVDKNEWPCYTNDILEIDMNDFQYRELTE
jgi:hypothetical protein